MKKLLKQEIEARFLNTAYEITKSENNREPTLLEVYSNYWEMGKP